MTLLKGRLKDLLIADDYVYGYGYGYGYGYSYGYGYGDGECKNNIQTNGIEILEK